MDALLPQRWFRFRLRTFLGFVAILAVLLAGFTARYQAAVRQREAVSAIESNGGTVHHDLESWSWRARDLCPVWLRDELGIDFFTHVRAVYVTKATTGREALVALPDLVEIQALGFEFTDESLAELRGLPRLEVLKLRLIRVTDAGLVHLRTLPQLRELDLSFTEVTDAGMPHVAACLQLQSLNLEATNLTAAGLEPLAALSELQTLQVSPMRVGSAGLHKLQQALPNCHINPPLRPENLGASRTLP